jgi:hypothetical protein
VIALAAESVGQQLLTLAWQGLGVTIAVTFCFSFALVGTIRASEARRDGHNAAVVSWTLLAVIAYAAFAAAAVLAIAVVVDK